MENECKNCEIKKTETVVLGMITEGSPRYECSISVIDASRRNEIKKVFEQKANKSINGGTDCPYMHNVAAKLLQDNCIYFEIK